MPNCFFLIGKQYFWNVWAANHFISFQNTSISDSTFQKFCKIVQNWDWTITFLYSFFKNQNVRDKSCLVELNNHCSFIQVVDRSYRVRAKDSSILFSLPCLEFGWESPDLSNILKQNIWVLLFQLIFPNKVYNLITISQFSNVSINPTEMIACLHKDTSYLRT